MSLVFIFPLYLLFLFLGPGLLIVISSLVLRANPARHVAWEAIIVLSSAVSSLQSPVWLYYAPPLGVSLPVGVVLGLWGGVCWIRWKTRPPPR